MENTLKRKVGLTEFHSRVIANIPYQMNSRSSMRNSSKHGEIMRPYLRHQCHTQSNHSMGGRDSRHTPILQWEDHKHTLKALRSMILNDTTVRALKVCFFFGSLISFFFGDDD
ncbi:hypothetical protein T310_10235 [Rasamsonia emersonii CBS 393.64]|uniref:Uncharacterized protein n=1 Tax=Rasamsonia emersonii (strain ATCC 16479 / CBS 393.64 / IMI 116815) TaxID=1408163 RepID=A0A0F4YDL5_RASE3|nr:hypothetical protein T310_10235 [Rasamsonia emersonii CBS 393.64]KKA16185.1 hypothetical protein T310_10235 [Rasamsonia emersonii CBS 393.64]